MSPSAVEREILATATPPSTRLYPAHPPPVRQDNRPTVLLVTVCTMNRQPILATEDVHQSLCHAWSGAMDWLVGYYLVMPDHVHLFCAPGTLTARKVKTWAKYWKRLASLSCPRLEAHWQKDCWDTQMRDLAHYNRKLEYVANNPVRYGLVTDPADWPYQGRLFDLHW